LARLAAGFVGNDSGVSHLAAAAGAPGVAIFGPTDPDRWRPIGWVRVVRALKLAYLAPPEVASALREIIEMP
jgi:ADP-heptose:LPS heptosyltransferase